jgi:cytochrome P450
MLVVGLGYEFSIGLLLQFIPLPGIGSVRKMFSRMSNAGQEAAVVARESAARTIFSQMLPDDGSEPPLSDSVIAQEAIADIVAGSDTTLAAVVYIIYGVLSYPAVKERLLDELRTCSPRPGWEELESKSYLAHVIDEGLRLYPPIPSSLPRKVPEGGVTMGGLRLPAGCVLSCQALTMHRNPDVFLSPDRFMPERWQEATTAMKESFMPFGGSMRCKSARRT